MTGPRSVEFDYECLPWLDKYYLEIDSYVNRLSANDCPPYDLREQLVHWVQNGFVRFPQAIGEPLIDAYLADIEAFHVDRATSGVKLTIEGFGVERARDLPLEAWSQHHLRIMDFHNASTAGKALAMHPVVVEFLRHVFQSPPVAMQTLTFLYGTEQTHHQDFPYVVAEIPSNLAAAWVALEDVDPAAGPLFYYPGSHSIRKFDWGNGLFLTQDSAQTPEDFAEYLETTVTKLGTTRRTFCPVDDPDLMRRSLVTHYSSSPGYTRDRREPTSVPLVYEMNGGLLFADPTNLDEEDRYQSWPLPAATSVSRRDLRCDIIGEGVGRKQRRTLSRPPGSR
jgi:phytanoyl-CoA hydroxylase